MSLQFLSICLSVCLSVSVCLFVCLSACLYIFLLILLFAVLLSSFRFDVSISELRKIILPQCLLRSPEFTGLLSPSTKESFELVPSNTDTTKDDEVSLLDWISAHVRI